jgi:hypothetical protein
VARRTFQSLLLRLNSELRTRSSISIFTATPKNAEDCWQFNNCFIRFHLVYLCFFQEMYQKKEEEEKKEHVQACVIDHHIGLSTLSSYGCHRGLNTNPRRNRQWVKQ